MIRTSVFVIRATVLFHVKIQNDHFEFLTVKMNTSIVAHAVVRMLIAWDSLCEKIWNAAVKMLTATFAIVFVSAAQIHSILFS